ncbi:MAG: AraC family transcriptional regulator [Acidobacteriia bacterium]|nr:AraC family transcriptional regulator [Terriglobia bacterium]
MNKHFRVSGSTFLKLEDRGVPACVVLRRAGLPRGFIEQPRMLLSTEELFALWRAVGEVSTNPAIGLLLGTETKTERFHPIGLAALSSENFGGAMEQMARYKQLTCPEEILQETDYLNNSLLELNEIAYLLGYEDANSFVRAFRTWEGVPPARWREAQRAKAASEPVSIGSKEEQCKSEKLEKAIWKSLLSDSAAWE